MALNPKNLPINVPLMQFAMYLGLKYNARVISWGRDLQGNRDAGSTDDNSWHRWMRGANAIDLKPQDPKDLALMADEAKAYGYQRKVYRTSIHIEVPW